MILLLFFLVATALVQSYVDALGPYHRRTPDVRGGYYGPAQSNANPRQLDFARGASTPRWVYSSDSFTFEDESHSKKSNCKRMDIRELQNGGKIDVFFLSTVADEIRGHDVGKNGYGIKSGVGGSQRVGDGTLFYYVGTNGRGGAAFKSKDSIECRDVPNSNVESGLCISIKGKGIYSLDDGRGVGLGVYNEEVAKVLKSASNRFNAMRKAQEAGKKLKACHRQKMERDMKRRAREMEEGRRRIAARAMIPFRHVK